MGDNRAFRGHQTTVTIRRVPRGSPGCLAPFALALLHGVGLGGSWHFAPPLCVSPRPAGLGNRGAAGAADAAGPGSRLPPGPVSRPLPRAGPVPLLREEERSPFLHVRLAGGGEAAVSFSESHLQPAPLSPSGSRSSILSLSHHAGQSRMPCPSPHQTSPLLIATAGAWPGPPRPLRLLGVKSTLIA